MHLMPNANDSRLAEFNHSHGPDGRFASGAMAPGEAAGGAASAATVYTKADIKAANTKAGQHYFDKNTRQFFDSHVSSQVYHGPGGVHFVTSERMLNSTGTSAPRRYSVHKFDPATGGVSEVGAFNAMSRGAAHRLAKHASAGTRPQSRFQETHATLHHLE